MSGTWHLLGADKKDMPKELRFPRFLRLLMDLVKNCRKRYECEPEIAFESVVNHGKSGVKNAHSYGGLKALVYIVVHASRKKLKLWEVPVGTWKRIAIGHGGADKKMYVRVVTEITGIAMKPTPDEDRAAAIGVGLAALTKEFRSK